MEFLKSILEEGFKKEGINVERAGFFNDFTGPTIEMTVNNNENRCSIQIMRSNANANDGILNAEGAIKKTQKIIINAMGKVLKDEGITVKISGDVIENSTHMHLEKDGKYYICYIDDKK